MASTSTDSERVEFAVAWAKANGLLMASPTSAVEMVHVPFSLRPTKLPRFAFEEAMRLAPIYNRLFDAVARDTEWLSTTLERTAAIDDFTGRLFKLHQKAQESGSQPLMLGIHRSDYMLHVEDGTPSSILQVEFNTIASAFGALSTRVSELHRTLATRFEGGHSVTNMPENKALQGIAGGLAAAHAARAIEGSVVLFVVQPGERNVMDQRMLEFELLSSHGIQVSRMSLAAVAEKGRRSDDGDLLVPHGGAQCPVSVVYFRAGYTPTDYPSEKEWAGRELIELTSPIKCPSVAYHLAGTKKVQQALAAPGAVERFISDAEEAAAVRRSFAGLWSLDSGDGAVEEVIAAAKAAPEKYVLKPQREGGGNNFYGADLVAALDRLSSEELAAYILMERIFPPNPEGSLVRGGEVTECATVSELGVYSVFLSDGSSVPSVNNCAGYLLRTKAVGVDEGGVASGFSVLDSVMME